MKREDQEAFERKMAKLRAKWPPGPWTAEPDRVDWKSSVGYPCFIKRNILGAWCGYVGLTEGHPAYGHDYTRKYEKLPDGDDDFERPIDGPLDMIQVHGGVTYGDKCSGLICHVAAPGEPDQLWWIGFDCNHGFDDAPGIGACLGEYRDVAYAREETNLLALQLKALETAP